MLIGVKVGVTQNDLLLPHESERDRKTKTDQISKKNQKNSLFVPSLRYFFK